MSCLSFSLCLSLFALLLAKRNNSAGAQKTKLMLADNGNGDALSIFLANIPSDAAPD